MEDVTGMFPIHSQAGPFDKDVIIEWPTRADASGVLTAGVAIYNAVTQEKIPGALTMSLVVDPRSAYPTAHVIHCVDENWKPASPAHIGPGGRPLTAAFTYRVVGYRGAWNEPQAPQETDETAPCIHVQHVQDEIKAGADYDPFTDSMGVEHRWDMDWLAWVHPGGQLMCESVGCNASSYLPGRHPSTREDV